MQLFCSSACMDRDFGIQNLEKKQLGRKAFIWLFMGGISRITWRFFAQIRRLEALYFLTCIILLPYNSTPTEPPKGIDLSPFKIPVSVLMNS